jgi:diaminohydroxyphosphoribosylaminopyrimidine deaminase/5-amino-6-(5-phosphoribosylamino)uracil reductase
MIEGGAALNGAALAAGIVDKVFLYYAPTILGTGSVPFATGASFRGDEALRLDRARLHQFEDDIALEGYLRDPYAE